MGSMTDAHIRAWQQHVGLQPPTGQRAEALQHLQALAFDLIRVCELERSGIRGGDGHWHGCDVVDALAQNIRDAAITLPDQKD
jgi:hypothetical protein